jgi:two-component system, response regulator YesN
MYKLLIVDDEYFVREGLSRFDWGRLGFEVKGICGNGMSAYKFISENYVDVVITDIKMPIMDGIQLSETLCKQFPSVKIIILSGYDEFDYARACLRNGAIDYLIKPINNTNLIETFTRVREILNTEQKNKNHINLLENRTLHQTKLLRKHYMRDILYKKLSSETLDEICVYSEVLLESECFVVCLMRLDELKRNHKIKEKVDWELLLFAVENILSEFWFEKEYGYHWVDENTGDCYLLVTKCGLCWDDSELYRCLENIRKNIYKIGGILRSTISIAVGKTVENREDIYLSRKTSEEIMNQIIIDDSYSRYSQVSIIETDHNIIEEKPALKKPAFQENSKSGKYIVEAALKYVEENYARSITLTTVADNIHVNASYLSYVFKEVTGENFIQYVTRKRLDKACRLLEESVYKVYEIGQLSGYENDKYFNYIFKKHIGKTPYEFRNMKR